MARLVRQTAGLGLVVAALVAVATVAFAASPASPPPPTVAAPHGGIPAIYAGPYGRAQLDGLWRFRRDPKAVGTDRGFQNGRFKGSLVRTPYVPDASKIRGKAGLKSFRGTVGWYRTNLTVPRSGRYAIRFESVNHAARVYLDGERVDTHKGEYLPFETRVDLQAGQRHRLVVRADWRCPTCMKRDGWHRLWWNFGGINRDVTIRPIEASEITRPTLRTRLRSDGAAVVTVSAVLRNNAAAREIETKGVLRHADRSVELTFPKVPLDAGRNRTVVAETVIDKPALWSPETPNLWDLDLQVPGESGYRARVGVREVRADGRRLLLNGERVYLRGASIHEDVAGRGDALLPRDHDAIAVALKAINANATRAQHPLHPALIERLDRAGIMVWQGVGPTDAPGAWTSRGARRVRVAKQRVRTTVNQQQLHPSIITWNLANEVAGGGHPAGQIPYVDSMAAELKRRDPSRPVALDIWGAHPPRKPSRIYRNIDMIGWTNYIGWYESTHAGDRQIAREIRTRLALLRRVFPDKVIAVTEFGAEANGLNPTNEPGGFSYQRNLLNLHLATYAGIDDVAGALIWNLRDFAVTPDFAGGSITSQVPDIRIVRGINQKGLFDTRNRAKPSVRAVSSRFAAQAAAGR